MISNHFYFPILFQPFAQISYGQTRDLFNLFGMQSGILAISYHAKIEVEKFYLASVGHTI